MDTGLMLGFEDSIATITELARQGEAAGCATMYTVEAGRNAVTCAAAVIAATERVRVGTYIVNAYARSPWLTGIAARDLDEMSDGRFVLGVGTGNPLFNKLYMGEDSSKPLAKMRDYIEVLRAVVAGRAGEKVRHEGPEHSIRWRATWDPTRPSIPVYLSASGPNMVRLAGEVSRWCRRRHHVIDHVHARHRAAQRHRGSRSSRTQTRRHSDSPWERCSVSTTMSRRLARQ